MHLIVQPQPVEEVSYWDGLLPIFTIGPIIGILEISILKAILHPEWNLNR